MRYSAGRFDRIEARLLEAAPALDFVEQRVAVGLARLLAEGEPVAPTRVASALDLPLDDVNGALSGLRSVVLDERGRAISACGLTVATTPHRFEVDSRELHTWCAWDALFLPELLGATARVQSTCPVTRTPISLEVAPDGPARASPATAVLVLVPPDGTAANPRDTFCRFVHFVAAPPEAQRWAAAHPPMLVLSLGEGHRLGHSVNHACFPAVLD